MKQLVSNYTFDKTAKTITFTDFTSGIALERLYLITNTTRNKILYQFNSTSLNATVSGNVLHLTTDTSSMDNQDKLQIIYDFDYLAPGEDAASNALRIESVSAEVSGTASANNSDAVPVVETSIYRYGSIQLSGTWVGTLTIQGSNDNTNWNTVTVSNLGSTSQQFATSLTANGVYGFPIAFRYLRARTTAWTSGTVTATGELYSLPVFPAALGAAVGANSATGSPVPANAHYMGMLGQDGNLIGLRSSEVDNVTVGSLRTNTYLYDGTKSDRARTLSKIKNIYANSLGNTALWTPAAGKRFRILGCRVSATANIAAASGGVLDVRLYDGPSTSIGLSHSLYCPATAVTTTPGSAYDSGWMDLRNGYLSTAVDTVLNVNLSVALTAGGIQTIVVGTEE